ncbi:MULTISPECIES: YciI family protein [unclassified Nocardiopsis]|uniref:YciI family protein n=1 Tax=unclassified Nocardiopsis TaxID=2649073 RepID=UPI00135871F4|nr:MULTISPECIES: YciI family protein [unclassified Nocardiopsis]
MAVFAVTYTYAPDSAAARDEHRPAHREYLGELSGRGANLCSGPFGPEEVPGALLLLRADSKEEALALTEKDPFRVQGLVTEVGVQEWVPVLGPLAEHF